MFQPGKKPIGLLLSAVRRCPGRPGSIEPWLGVGGFLIEQAVTVLVAPERPSVDARKIRTAI